jgi:putative metalloprotease
MTRLLPILLLIIGVFAMVKISAWQSGKQLRRTSKPLMNDQVEALFKRLARTAGIENIEVRLLDMPVVNGLATPSGEIYITRGLFRKFQAGRITAAELASVVAHEMGHLALGHTKRRIIDVTGAQTIHMVLGSILLGAEPQARMLEKLLELVPEASMQETNWLASHPPVAERTGAIRANAARWEETAE